MSRPETARENPFPGLRPFRTDEHHLFFGREDQTNELLKLLREHRFIGVVGTSGSGKSSLVRAGLIPALHRGTMTLAGSAWEIVVLRPGGDPIAQLARALIEADLYDARDPEALPRMRATLKRSRFGLVEAVKQSDDLEPDTNILVVVDQFEELFRFRQQSTESEETATAFVNLLLAASESQEQRIYVTITMRSDYLGDCSEIPGLAEAVNRGEYLIPRLLRDQKRDAIEKPVGVEGAKIAPRLVQKMLNAVGDDPDQLPVLQHALMRTWDVWSSDHGDDEPIDLRHFEATGGMEEALSRHADEIYNALPDETHRLACERIFKSLTEKGTDNRGIRRPTRLNRLSDIVGQDRRVLLHVLDSFRCPGVTFLMPGLERELTDRAVLDLSHESLMRAWRRLRAWVEDEAQSARIYARLVDTASLWREGKAGLFRDPDLQIALSWRETALPNAAWAEQYGGRYELATEFLESSHEAAAAAEKEVEAARRRELEQARTLAEHEARRAEERDRAAKRLRVLAVVGVLIALAAVLAFVQARAARRDADSNARLAAEKEQVATETAAQLERVLVRSDFNQCAQLLEAGNPAEGLAFAARSLRTDPNYWPAGVRALSSLASGRFRLEDLPVVEQDRPICCWLRNREEDLILTNDDHVIEPGDIPQCFVVDLRTGERLYQLAGGESVSHRLWSVDGQLLLALDAAGKNLLGWAARSGEEVVRIELESSAGGTPFAQGTHPELGDLVSVISDDDGAVRLLSLRSRALAAPPFSRPGARCLTHGFSPDGLLHWTWHSDGAILVREISSGRIVLETPPRQWSSRVQFTADGRWLLASSGQGLSVGWWPIPRAGLPETDGGEGDADAGPPSTEGGWIDFAAPTSQFLLPSETRVALFQNDNSARTLHVEVRDLETREKTASFDPTSTSTDGSPGRWLYWGAGQLSAPPQSWTLRFPLVMVVEEAMPSSVVIWDLESGEPIQRIFTESRISQVVLSPDGVQVATVAANGDLMLWYLLEGTALLPEPIEHEGRVTIVYSPNGHQFLTSEWPPRAIEIRATSTGERLFEPVIGASFQVAEFSSRGDRVALYDRTTTTSTTFSNRLTEGRFTIADLTPRPIVFEPLLPGSRGTASLASYAATGDAIVVAGKETTTGPAELLRFDARTRRRTQAVQLPDGETPTSLHLGPDGRTAVLGTSEARVYVVDTEAGRIVHEIILPRPPTVLALSLDGSRGAAADRSGEVHVFEVATGAPVGSPLQHGSTEIDTLTLDREGRLLASASSDYTFRIVDLESGLEKIPEVRLSNVGQGVELLADGKQAALVSFAESVPIVDLETGQVLRELDHLWNCTVAQLSPDGELLAVGCGIGRGRTSGAVYLWDWRTGARTANVLSHEGQVARLEFSRDGALIATGTRGTNGAVQVWDVESGRPLTDPARAGGDVSQISFDPTGSSVVVAWRGGSVRVIDLPPRATPQPEWLPALVEAVTGQRLASGKQSATTLTPRERREARAAVEVALASAPAEDEHARWARWFLSPPGERTISPRSSTLLTEYLRAKSTSSNFTDLQEVLLLAPNNAVALARSGLVGLSLVDDSPSLQQLSAALRRHWHDVVEAAVDSAIESEPENPELWMIRAELLEKLGRHGEASEAIRRASELGSSSTANVAYLTALTLLREGSDDRADTAFDEAIEALVEQSAEGDSAVSSTPLVGYLPLLEPLEVAFGLARVRLPAPIPGTLEDFDAIEASSAPPGWTLGSQKSRTPTPPDGSGWRTLDVESAPDWVIGDARLLRPGVKREPVFLNDRWPTALVSRRHLVTVPRTAGSVRPLRIIESPDFDLEGRREVHLAFHSELSLAASTIAAVEYSVDGGQTWLPAAYFLSAGDSVLDDDGAVDAVATFERVRSDLPWFVDTDGELRGRSYGDFIAAEVGPALAPHIRSRGAGAEEPSLRFELVRLPRADGARRARLRFAFAGAPGGPPWLIDHIGLYEMLPRSDDPSPARSEVSSDPAILAGIGLQIVRRGAQMTTLSAALDRDAFEVLPIADPELGEARWIWSSAESSPGELVLLRKSFEVDKPVRAARVAAACDDRLELWLNGELVLSGSGLENLTTASLTGTMRPGRNELTIRAQNERGTTGAAFLRLQVLFEDGEMRELVTDESWSATASADGNFAAASADESQWSNAFVHGAYGVEPWGRPFSSSSALENERAAATLFARRAVRLAPEDPWVLLAAAYVEGRSGFGDLERAFTHASRALELEAPEKPALRVLAALWAARGDELQRQNDTRGAAVAYELAQVLLESIASNLAPHLLERIAGLGLELESELIVPRNSRWRYLDVGPYPPDEWKDPEFDDTTWLEGEANLGYGDRHVRTRVRPGNDRRTLRITTHFRRALDVEDPSRYGYLKLRLQRDDGAVVYLNGTEVVRDRMPAGAIEPLTTATVAVPDGSMETEFAEFPIVATRLRPGRNVIAVEVHQSSSRSSDLGFDLELEGVGTLGAQLADFALLDTTETALGIAPRFRALLWAARAGRLAAAGELPRASEALERARSLEALLPRVRYEEAMLALAKEDPAGAFEAFVAAVRSSITSQNAPRRATGGFLPGSLAAVTTRIVAPSAMAFEFCSELLLKSRTPDAEHHARWLLAWGEETATSIEERLAIAGRWLPIDPERALAVATAALAEAEAAPSTARSLRQRRDALLLQARALRALERTAEADELARRLAEPPPRPAELPPRLIDLSSHFTHSLYATSWRGEPGDDTSLALLPETYRARRGVPFDLRGLVQLDSGVYGDESPLPELRGKDLDEVSGRSHPTEVGPIEVDLRAARLHVLASTIWGAADRGDVVARLRVVYSDGKTAELPLRFGEDLADCAAPSLEIAPERIAWIGRSSTTRLHLTVTTWENPSPESTIESLHLVSERVSAAPFVVAITAEE